MTLYERISYLAKKQGMSVFDLAEKLDLSRNSIYSWKKSSPKAETLEKVAEYFDVSTDYLLGRDTSKLQKADPEEEKIITMFRKNTAGMTEEEKREFNESMDKLMDFAKDLFEKDRKSGK
ncbi:TPA: helix-turn-helix transcriptional regulator [Enterococcus faecalis]|uniref:helix-turn-helix domain-containing protein n=1 Tax=Enterococcus faecalis TaxID=1351 RepID=UPI001F0175E1|nr:helix-turn-helix transcriptional regulator [Enterococcus faecalis]